MCATAKTCLECKVERSHTVIITLFRGRGVPASSSDVLQPQQRCRSGPAIAEARGCSEFGVHVACACVDRSTKTAVLHMLDSFMAAAQARCRARALGLGGGGNTSGGAGCLA